MIEKPIRTVLFGAGITFVGTIAVWIFLGVLGDSSLGYHELLICAGWVLFAACRIALGLLCILFKKNRATAINNIAFGVGAILLSTTFLFLPVD